MSVQFDPITALTPVHLGWWWDDERRAKYPRCEERPPLEPVVEDFGPPTSPAFNLRLSGTPPTPASWFFTEDGRELVQVQRDRFTRNWLRPSPDEPYPSYNALRPRFADDFAEFSDFMSEHGFGALSLTQCELTYINPLTPTSGVWQLHGDLPALFAPWSGGYSEDFLPVPDDVQIGMRFVIPAEDGAPMGRLHVALQPGYNGDVPTFVLTLTARGKPTGAGLDGALAFLDLAHTWIVKGFTTLTTESMHREWGRTR